MHRTACAILLATAALGVAACGGDDDDKPDETAEIRNAVTQVYQGRRERDYAQSCAFLTEQSKRDLVQIAGANGGKGTTTCAQALGVLEKLAKTNPDDLPTPSAISDARVTVVSGVRATVRIAGIDTPTTLVKERGKWLTTLGY